MLFALTAIVGLYLLGCGSSNNVDISSDQNLVESQADSAETETTARLSEEEMLAQQQHEQLEEEYRRVLRERFQGQANGITTYYVSAQQLFYMGRYQSALYHINKAAEIKETADILALRGSIYLGLGNNDKFTEQWRLALEMDENVPIPNVPYLIQKLKEEGLISQNYNPEN